MSAMSMLYSMLLDFEKSEYWYKKLTDYRDKAKGSSRREATQRIVYLDISLPGRGSINSLSSTTPKARNIDKNKQKWYNRSARKIAETSKKACTSGGAYV
ncbi:MAG: hypothetical protein SOZ56_10825 [Oscillospiraceae bacterium]|nr:hypothetical protein [Oscillospiraceae bacterium]